MKSPETVGVAILESGNITVSPSQMESDLELEELGMTVKFVVIVLSHPAVFEMCVM